MNNLLWHSEMNCSHSACDLTTAAGELRRLVLCRAELAAMARSSSERRRAPRRSAHRMERDQERQVEGENPWRGNSHTCHLGEQSFRPDRHTHGQKGGSETG